jgi:hypothetical protein
MVAATGQWSEAGVAAGPRSCVRAALRGVIGVQRYSQFRFQDRGSQGLCLPAEAEACLPRSCSHGRGPTIDGPAVSICNGLSTGHDDISERRAGFTPPAGIRTEAAVRAQSEDKVEDLRGDRRPHARFR